MSKTKLYITSPNYELYLGDIESTVSSTGSFLAGADFDMSMLNNLLVDTSFWQLDGAESFRTDLIQLVSSPQHFLGILLTNGFELEVSSLNGTRTKLLNDLKKVSFVLKGGLKEKILGNFYSSPFMDEDISFVVFANHYCHLNLAGLLGKVISGARILAQDPGEKCLLERSGQQTVLGRTCTATLFKTNFAAS